MWVGDKDVTDIATGIRVGGDEIGDPVIAFSEHFAVGLFEIPSSSGYSLNTWHAVTGVFASAISRRIYLGGGNSQESLVFFLVGAVDRTQIGGAGDSTPDRFFSGSVVEAAIWNVALSADEVRILAAGYSPLCLTNRLGNLVLYRDLIRPLNRPGIGPNMTATGTTVSDHPRVQTPTGLLLAYPPIIPKVDEPFCVETADVWTPTAAAGQEFSVGTKQEEAVSTGPAAGEVNC